MRCPKCGADLKAGARFCGKCGTMIPVSPTPPSPPKPTPTPIPIHGSANRMPQGIALGVGESVVKQYRIGRYFMRKGSIDVIVTNKRVIRYEESSLFGLQNNQIDEINIDAVHGISTHMRRSVSLLGMLSALILLVFGLLYFTYFHNLRSFYRTAPYEYLFLIVVLGLVGLIVFFSIRPTLEFEVLGAIGSGALGTVVNRRGRFFRNDSNSIIFQFKPTEETTVMLKEIGACIYDLKTLGDKAVDQWR